jgi:hypothetical protein
MSEDIRSMLTNRAKVLPRNNALKLGTSKFDEDEVVEEISITLDSQELEKSPSTFEETSPHKQKKQAEKTAKNDGKQIKSTQESADLKKVAISRNQPDPAEDKTTTVPSSSDLRKIEAELEKLPQVGKRLAIHLEQKVRADLLNLCDRQEITPEVFLEATFVILQNQGNLLEEIVTDAKERLAARKKAGFLRRTISMIGKIG